MPLRCGRLTYDSHGLIAMKYRYTHFEEYEDGSGGLPNIIWDMEGKWPKGDNTFPPEHPSNRFADEFAAFREREYRVEFFATGEACCLVFDRKRSIKQVMVDIRECLGWERIYPGDLPQPSAN